jgi:carbohydrate-binding DOMON domain-containing protein
VHLENTAPSKVVRAEGRTISFKEIHSANNNVGNTVSAGGSLTSANSQQVEKHDSLNVVTVSGIRIRVSEVFLKALLRINVTAAGITNSDRPTQFAKRYETIPVTFEGSDISTRDSHPKKHHSPIVRIESGRSIATSDIQLKNASRSIKVTDGGTSILTRL